MKRIFFFVLAALIVTNARAQESDETPSNESSHAVTPPVTPRPAPEPADQDDGPTSMPERHHPLKNSASEHDENENNRPNRRSRDREERNEMRNRRRYDRKGFVIDAQLFGLTAPNNLSLVSGVTLGGYVSSNLLLSADYTYASAAEGSDYSGRADVRSFGAHARYFIGHSFNMRFGAVYRDMTSTSYEFFQTPRVSTTRQDAGFDVAIGNLWTFGSGFMLGADWFTYIQPLWSHQNSINGPPENLDGANYEFAKLILGFNF